jgi:hypothetical protein
MYPSHQARSRLSIWRFGHRFIHSAVLARHALTLALSNSAIAVFFFSSLLHVMVEEILF